MIVPGKTLCTAIEGEAFIIPSGDKVRIGIAIHAMCPLCLIEQRTVIGVNEGEVFAMPQLWCGCRDEPRDYGLEWCDLCVSMSCSCIRYVEQEKPRIP